MNSTLGQGLHAVVLFLAVLFLAVVRAVVAFRLLFLRFAPFFFAMLLMFEKSRPRRGKAMLEHPSTINQSSLEYNGG